jgi:hypothetical protein
VTHEGFVALRTIVSGAEATGAATFAAGTGAAAGAVVAATAGAGGAASVDFGADDAAVAVPDVPTMAEDADDEWLLAAGRVATTAITIAASTPTDTNATGNMRAAFVQSAGARFSASAGGVTTTGANCAKYSRVV